MSDFLIEVDEALKQERLEKLWEKYGGLFIAIIASIILVTAANSGYEAWTQNRNYKQTDLFLDKLDNPDLTAQELLSIVPELSDGMKEFVELQAAGLALKSNDKATALSIFGQIEASKENKKYSDDIYSLARYMATNIDETIPVDEKIKRYDSIIANQSSPWRYHAMMDTALLYANVSQNYEKAREYLSMINNEKMVAESLKKKAQSLDILYEAMGFQKNSVQIK